MQKDDSLRSIFGAAAVMGGVAYMATTVARPGVIAQTGSLQRMIFGEYDGRRSDRAQALLAASLKGGINAELSTDIRRAIWEKYVFLVGLSGSTTAMRAPLGPIRSNPETRAVPARPDARSGCGRPRPRGCACRRTTPTSGSTFADTLPHDMTSSMHHDLQRGRPLEVRWLSGGVAELGAAIGVPTPVNRAVRDILLLYAAGHGEGAHPGGT